ncbi:hypothetical protein Tco_0891209 [Tanacetum coccineum]|uniref:Reverse transcriptase zinc-binding domain-containing protein n=1 Tax=Tanacetum coccineum TaxID=301880 RepID=A0ABQ5C580_9ASTR
MRGGVWKNIIKTGMELDRQGINFSNSFVKKVGNGENTLFWEDLWVEDGSLCDNFPRLYELESNKHVARGMLGGGVWMTKAFFSVKCLVGKIEDCWRSGNTNVQETRWNNLVPRKVNVFVWRAERGRLRVRWELVEWSSGYLLWKNRNDVVFGGKKSVEGNKLFKEVQLKSLEWVCRRSSKGCLLWDQWVSMP